ncbi:unnamed protein product [Cladocopium goreaui]|uniref:Phytanoyl-CoA dioxygenase n=1 Tax=Cladocopium goreaui TaxID=2562237 RepID=A0A9P1DBZ5_9DINO|nr:unnamed protein product [Cladocopium goreaui]
MNLEEELFRACPQHGLHSLKSLEGCCFISEASGVVSGQSWLWADDEETVEVFDELANILLQHLPRREEMRLYTASFTVIQHAVEDEDSKWHVDWHGIPEGLCWTLLVPIWPSVPEDWRSMGGTQLCRHRDHRQMLWSAGKTVPGSLRDLLVEAALPPEDFEVIEHCYRPCECLLFEGNVLHRTGPYSKPSHGPRVLASLMVGPKDPEHFPAVDRSLRKQGACFLRDNAGKNNDGGDRAERLVELQTEEKQTADVDAVELGAPMAPEKALLSAGTSSAVALSVPGHVLEIPKGELLNDSRSWTLADAARTPALNDSGLVGEEGLEQVRWEKPASCDTTESQKLSKRATPR